MTDPIDPLHPARGDRRQRARRLNDPAPAVAAEAAKAPAQLPVAVTPPPVIDAKPMLSAHLIGQDGQRRGLRGGQEILSKAKAAYLNAEWSGPTDRRYPPGVISKTKV